LDLITEYQVLNLFAYIFIIRGKTVISKKKCGDYCTNKKSILFCICFYSNPDSTHPKEKSPKNKILELTFNWFNYSIVALLVLSPVASGMVYIYPSYQIPPLSIPS